MHTHELKLALVQLDIVNGNPSKSRERAGCLLENLSPDTDLILLPEMFTTGFTQKPQNVAESMQGETLAWMQTMAQAKNAVVGGSLVVAHGDGYFNRFVAAYPSGEIQWYDKRHLFRMGEEHKTYKPGMEKKVIDIKGWRCALFVCYDLRFPVWARATNDYDLALYVANWPQPRIEVWNTLLKARAIENQCYVAGVNRVGQDGLGRYNGSSQIVDFKGNIIVAAMDEREGIIEASLSMEPLKAFRKDFPVWMDADDFNIVI